LPENHALAQGQNRAIRIFLILSAPENFATSSGGKLVVAYGAPRSARESRGVLVFTCHSSHALLPQRLVSPSACGATHRHTLRDGTLPAQRSFFLGWGGGGHSDQHCGASRIARSSIPWIGQSVVADEKRLYHHLIPRVPSARSSRGYGLRGRRPRTPGVIPFAPASRGKPSFDHRRVRLKRKPTCTCNQVHLFRQLCADLSNRAAKSAHCPT